RNILLVRLERCQDRTELEIGAGAGRRPLIQCRTVRRVPHDRAVRNIEEARPQLGNRRGLGKSRAGRHHRIPEWQPPRDSSGLQNCSATNVLLGDEHLISYLASIASEPCLRKASLLTIPNTIEDSL